VLLLDESARDSDEAISGLHRPASYARFTSLSTNTHTRTPIIKDLIEDVTSAIHRYDASQTIDNDFRKVAAIPQALHLNQTWDYCDLGVQNNVIWGDIICHA